MHGQHVCLGSKVEIEAFLRCVSLPPTADITGLGSHVRLCQDRTFGASRRGLKASSALLGFTPGTYRLRAVGLPGVGLVGVRRS